ncbi:MAG TPA: hypothetical protein VIG07_18455 [Methylomirabilota bacterium]
MTLAEVLAALTLLSVGLVAMVSLLPLAGFGVHEGGYRSGATFLAWQRLEQIRHAVGTAEPSNDPLAQAALSFPDEPAVAPPHGAFGRSVRVQDCGLGCSGVQTPGVRQVTVTVTYPAGAPHGAAPMHRNAVTLSTYIGPR